MTITEGLTSFGERIAAFFCLAGRDFGPIILDVTRRVKSVTARCVCAVKRNHLIFNRFQIAAIPNAPARFCKSLGVRCLKFTAGVRKNRKWGGNMQEGVLRWWLEGPVRG